MPDLDAIRRRAEIARPVYGHMWFVDDVDDLIAEVKRLRAALEHYAADWLAPYNACAREALEPVEGVPAQEGLRLTQEQLDGLRGAIADLDEQEGRE